MKVRSLYISAQAVGQLRLLFRDAGLTIGSPIGLPVQLPDFPKPSLPVALDVDSRRRHRRVPQDLLRDVERNIGFGAVHAEGMAQGVRADTSRARGFRRVLPKSPGKRSDVRSIRWCSPLAL